MIRQNNNAPQIAATGNAYHNLILPDSRLRDRLDQIAKSIESNPAQSFPNVFISKAELEGFYRFVNNQRVDSTTLFKGAAEAAFEIMKQRKDDVFLAIHDTTTFSFKTDHLIEGLGYVTSTQQGFWGHFCIGVSKRREILGILDMNPFTRELGGKRKTRKELHADPNHEGRRWGKLIQEIHNKSPDSRKLIHIADREADDYATFCGLVASKVRFVFRASYERNILQNGEKAKLFETIRSISAVCEKEVPIASRPKNKMPSSQKSHPQRMARTAKLGLSATKIEICRGGNAERNKTPDTLSLNYVRVAELNPPEGEPSVEWLLVTSEPINDKIDLLQVVDLYCSRWVIEEYFKALKTGCAFEKRGFESYHAILNTLAILAPIAAKVYNLKIMGRVEPNQPSVSVVTPIQIRILAHFTRRNEEQIQTLGEAMLAVAALGGHIKFNGPPGWQVLARGYEKLLSLEQGWLLSQQLASQVALEHRNM